MPNTVAKSYRVRRRPAQGGQLPLEFSNTEVLHPAVSHPAALPFVKWVGGKRKLIAEILHCAPAHFDRYLEPFVGGGAVALALEHEDTLLNDANADLINTYRAVQNDVDALIGLLDAHRARHSEEYFYEVRALDTESLSPTEQAARLIYLNKTCFNGLYRVNQSGQFNAPFGKHLEPVLYDEGNLRAAHRALQGARLFTGDYLAFLEENARPGDFIYLDPPYEPVSAYSDFKRYTKKQFRVNDQEVLADLYNRLVQRGCYPVLSNSDTPRTRELYSGHCITTVFATRNINKNASGRGAIAEILVMPKHTESTIPVTPMIISGTEE